MWNLSDSKHFKTANNAFCIKKQGYENSVTQKIKSKKVLGSLLCQFGMRSSVFLLSGNRLPRNSYSWRWSHDPNASYYKQQSTIELFHYITISIVAFKMTLKLRFIGALKLNWILLCKEQRDLAWSYLHFLPNQRHMNEWFYFARTIYSLFFNVDETSFNPISSGQIHT